MKVRSDSKLRSRSLGRVQDRLAAFKRAVEVAEKLLKEADGEGEPARREYLLGLAQYQLEDYDSAAEHLRASFKLDERAETAARLGVCAWRTGDLAAAESWLTQAFEMEPDGRIQTQIAGTHPSYVAILSQVALAGGRVEDAADAAQSALKLDKKDTAALSVLATTQLATGQAEAASKTLQAAVDSAPKFIAERLERQQALARGLAAAGVNLRPLTANLGDIGRFIV